MVMVTAVCASVSDVSKLNSQGLESLRSHHIWDAQRFTNKGQWNFYVTATLLLCFENSAYANVFVRLTHFGGKHPAVSVVDCVTLALVTCECKQTDQWDSSRLWTKPGIVL